MERLNAREARDAGWRTHLEKAREYPGSDLEYCRLNGLNRGTFGFYKRRLGFTGGKKRHRLKFVRLDPVAEKVNHLPDARWLAEFLISYQKNQ